MTTHRSHEILESVRQALSIAVKSLEFQESLKDVDLLSRLDEVEEGPSGLKLRIWSDELTLGQKISLERIILKALSDHQIPVPSVYFVRRKSGTTGESSPTPIKAAKRPFGITPDKKAIPGVRHVVIVASGKGGVGKSTISANLAVALSKMGYRSGLMDCDVYGPSAPILLGVKGEIQVGAHGKLMPMIGHGVKTVSFGFLSDVRTPVIWRGPLVGKAIEQLCYDVAWGDLDVLVVDMPPGTGDVQLTIAEKLPVHAAVIVTTPQDVALIDAHKAVSMFEKMEIPIAGVVENMAWYECRNCGHTDHIFGEDSFKEFLASRKLSLLTRIPLKREIRLQSDQGKPSALDLNSPFGQPFFELAQKIQKHLSL